MNCCASGSGSTRTRRYKVAWIASCVLYDRLKLLEIGGFSFWPRLPRYHSGEDVLVQNLAPAKALGMTTVWVDNGSERGDHGYDEAVVDHRITNVSEWLEEILGKSE